jgi:hypothetical protein
LDAGAGDITLTNASNDFTAAVSATGAAVQLTDANALTLGTVATTGNLSVNSTGALNLGTTTVGGNLAANSHNGAITQTGALAVTGTSSLDAGAGDITLTNASNDFTAAVSATGAAVQLTDANALTLGTVATTQDFLVASNGALDLGLLSVGGALSANSTNGDITQLGALTITGASTLNGGAGRVTLANSSNYFGGAVASSASVIDVQGNAGSSPFGLSSSTTATGASAQRPEIRGAATAGVAVSIFDGNTLLGTVTADAITGAWNYQVSNSLSAGTHSITARQTSGGVTSTSTSLSFVATSQESAVTPPVVPVAPPVVEMTLTPPPAAPLVIQVEPESVIAITSDTNQESTDQKSKSAVKGIPAIEPTLKVANDASLAVSLSNNLSSNFVALNPAKPDVALVTVNLLRAPTAQSIGIITVTLPMSMLSANADAEVLIPLGNHIKTTDFSSQNEALFTLPNGNQLPSWIKYNVMEKALVLGAVPGGSFPFQMMMNIDGQRSLIQIQGDL